ncbi:hypothetical protein P154DRAFT_578251 [Amniculicola lignicola CBS 123094]|uniref:Uncharacterized protein n=1 Tax=Amniculicola lignicola CBS 123094 TaxID=1392246 RepID=A0A6A5WKL4_9PLEO|nr:hypothetical protein P154DRAFT_578251 [Amniculicola lignicola CBS 123094]
MRPTVTVTELEHEYAGNYEGLNYQSVTYMVVDGQEEARAGGRDSDARSIMTMGSWIGGNRFANNMLSRFSLRQRVPGAFASSIFSTETMASPDIYLPKASLREYRWDDGESIYVASPGLCGLPSSVGSEWDVIRGRLLQDLRPILNALVKGGLPAEDTLIEVNICMAGHDVGVHNIELHPSIFIICRSKKCKKAMARAVVGLEYLPMFSEDRVYVRQQTMFRA